MVDMGIEHYLISGALVAIQAQRLVRKICKHCKIQENISASTMQEIEEFLPQNAKFYTGAGCKECNDTGYLGREMICEVLSISESLSSLIAKGASKEILKKQAIKDGFIDIYKNGIQKALDGVTTLQEVLRVAR